MEGKKYNTPSTNVIGVKSNTKQNSKSTETLEDKIKQGKVRVSKFGEVTIDYEKRADWMNKMNNWANEAAGCSCYRTDITWKEARAIENVFAQSPSGNYPESISQSKYCI
jgi:hypothetical protein